MTKSELIKDLKQFCGGSSFITNAELTTFLGWKNRTRVKERYLKDLSPVVGKSYFIGDVAEKIMERCV